MGFDLPLSETFVMHLAELPTGLFNRHGDEKLATKSWRPVSITPISKNDPGFPLDGILLERLFSLR